MIQRRKWKRRRSFKWRVREVNTEEKRGRKSTAMNV